jgi:hypothetical protein
MSQQAACASNTGSARVATTVRQRTRASVWSALRPLLAPLASVATQTELFTILILSFLAGSLQAALLATMGHRLRHLLRKQCLRSSVLRSEVPEAHRSSAAQLP